MGMYDEVRAINITHDNFKMEHNNLTFQTKDLECEMFEYCIFNNELYLEADSCGGYRRYDKAQKTEYNGIVNIYTDFTHSDVEYWIEYDLVIKNGEVIDVIAYEERAIKNNKDLASIRPNLPDNRVFIQISVKGCSEEKKKEVVAKLTDEKIQAIRELLEEASATISYPTKRDSNPLYGRLNNSSEYSNIMSVVQTMEDYTVSDHNKQVSLKTPHGDVLILDELQYLTNRH